MPAQPAPARLSGPSQAQRAAEALLAARAAQSAQSPDSWLGRQSVAAPSSPLPPRPVAPVLPTSFAQGRTGSLPDVGPGRSQPRRAPVDLDSLAPAATSHASRAPLAPALGYARSVVDLRIEQLAQDLHRRYRLGLPPLAPVDVERMLKAEEIVSSDLDLGTYEHPAILALMAARDPLGGNALGATARLLRRGAGDIVAKGIGGLIADSSTHAAVRSKAAEALRLGLSHVLVEDMAKVAVNMVEGERKAAVGELTDLVRRVRTPGQTVDDLLLDVLRLGWKGDVRREMLQRLLQAIVADPATVPRVEPAMLRHLHLLPRSFLLGIAAQLAMTERGRAPSKLARRVAERIADELPGKSDRQEAAADLFSAGAVPVKPVLGAGGALVPSKPAIRIEADGRVSVQGRPLETLGGQPMRSAAAALEQLQQLRRPIGPRPPLSLPLNRASPPPASPQRDYSDLGRERPAAWQTLADYRRRQNETKS